LKAPEKENRNMKIKKKDNILFSINLPPFYSKLKVDIAGMTYENAFSE